MIFDKIPRTYSSIQWGLFVFVLICPFLSFAQGFINYQAFIYENFNILQPGRDKIKQVVPYANLPVYVSVKLIKKDASDISTLFEEEHQNDTTDAMGMLNLRIGSIKSVEFNNIPWSSLSQDKVFLIISVFRTKYGPMINIDTSLLSVFPFSIKSKFTELSDSSGLAGLADSSRRARRAVNADTAIFSENAIRNVVLGSSDQSLIFNLHNGDTLRSPSLANIPKPTIVSLRPGSICKGDSVFLYSGPVPDTSLFKSFWHSSRGDTLTNVSSIKIVVNTDTRIVFGIQRLYPIAGLPTTSADTITLKATNFSNLIDSISQDPVFEKYAFCFNDTLPLPSHFNSSGTWRCLNPNLAEINSSNNVNNVTFKKAGQLTLGFFPYNGCPFDAFYFNCTVNSNNTIALSSASGTNAQRVTVNTAITNIAYSTTGATGATISGLPAGVFGSWACNVVTISGTPSATGTFNYTITMTGGCTGGNNTASGSITVDFRSGLPESR